MELKHLENTTLNSYKSVHKGLSAFNTGTLRRKRESVRSTWVNYKSSLYTIVSIFLPAKFPTFAHFLMEVALSKKPNKRMGEEVESWTNQRQGQMIPGNLMGLLQFYVDVNTLWIFPDSQLRSHWASFLKPPHVSHISSHIAHSGTCKQKKTWCHGVSAMGLAGNCELFLALTAQSISVHTTEVPESQDSAFSHCSTVIWALSTVHDQWHWTNGLDSSWALSVCLVDKGHHRGPMLRTLVLGANKLC